MKKIILVILAAIILFPVSCLAEINLVGDSGLEEIEIARKYSPFYGQDINIEIFNKFPQDYYQIKSTVFYQDGNQRTIERGWDEYGQVRGMSFEFVLNSQLCRYYFKNYSVSDCDKFSSRMIEYVNSLN
jgi:hypothetical protein